MKPCKRNMHSCYVTSRRRLQANQTPRNGIQVFPLHFFAGELGDSATYAQMYDIIQQIPGGDIDVFNIMCGLVPHDTNVSSMEMEVEAHAVELEASSVESEMPTSPTSPKRKPSAGLFAKNGKTPSSREVMAEVHNDDDTLPACLASLHRHPQLAPFDVLRNHFQIKALFLGADLDNSGKTN